MKLKKKNEKPTERYPHTISEDGYGLVIAYSRGVVSWVPKPYDSQPR